eukprot:3684081-Prymnesium_polylepis.1
MAAVTAVAMAMAWHEAGQEPYQQQELCTQWRSRREPLASSARQMRCGRCLMSTAAALAPQTQTPGPERESSAALAGANLRHQHRLHRHCPPVPVQQVWWQRRTQRREARGSQRSSWAASAEDPTSTHPGRLRPRTPARWPADGAASAASPNVQ